MVGDLKTGGVVTFAVGTVWESQGDASYQRLRSQRIALERLRPIRISV